jgi:hypothetical protein
MNMFMFSRHTNAKDSRCVCVCIARYSNMPCTSASLLESRVSLFRFPLEISKCAKYSKHVASNGRIKIMNHNFRK